MSATTPSAAKAPQANATEPPITNAATPRCTAFRRTICDPEMRISEAQRIGEIAHDLLAVRQQQVVPLRKSRQHRQREPVGHETYERCRVVLGMVDKAF